MAQDGILVAPGAYDGLSARLVEQAGFAVVYATGGGIARSWGVPDLGLLTMTEVTDRLASIVQATRLPVIADADAGYGNALNVMRTIREFERAGVAALHLEDQVTPKRCGHYEGKSVVSRGEMVKKIEAALETKTDPDLVLIARTDARAVLGLDEAIARGQLYARAGADVIFVEAPESVEELRQIAKAIDRPLLANMVKGGKTPLVPAAELERLGYKIVLYPSDPQRAAMHGMAEFLAHLKSRGTSEGFERITDWKERDAAVGLAEWQAREARFLRT